MDGDGGHCAARAGRLLHDALHHVGEDLRRQLHPRLLRRTHDLCCEEARPATPVAGTNETIPL